MRILLAEDHPTLAASIAEGLREAGYAVDVTGRGDEALGLARSEPYDAILLDLMLPGRDGLSVLRELREAGLTTPVLCLTARSSLDDRVTGLDAGADDYLVKPFDWAELLARTRSMLRRAHAVRDPLIRIADLEINTATARVSRAGRDISLSAREYSMLAYLAYRRGRIVTRTELWEHLYDMTEQTRSNVVDVYIGYLRNKIDRDHEVKLIHTHRGLGYSLGEES